ncbi:MipA/OmpV family protein [Plastorhodobacter daqingensis]|uniref:MipA/OmpV family protein n=1 Tax=Plastorhodobacter daqingensis TaxID=1387281 RepID=A0ABW2UJ28_9RHOB
MNAFIETTAWHVIGAIAAVLLLAGGATAQTSGGFAFSLRGGVEVAPDYFGSESYGVGPDIGFAFGSLSLPNGLVIGTPGSQPFDEGRILRGSFRYIKKRTADDHPELFGLEDIDGALEIGIGVGYVGPDWRVFGNLRYGVIGHESLVGELGFDSLFRISDALLIHAGPRVDLASSRFTRTYFGVSEAEAVASAFDAYRPSGGVVSVGLELGMRYAFNDRWALVGTASWDRLQGDARRSPITRQGSEDQFGVTLGLSRSFQLGG